MKRSGRKLLGILLSASIIATAVFPMQGMAVEKIDHVVEQEAQTEENATQEETTETTVPNDITQAEETIEPTVEPPAKETDDSTIIPPPETDDSATEPPMTETDDSAIEPPAKETDDSAIEPPAKEMDDFEIEPPTKETDEPSTTPATKETDEPSIMPFSYDINMPVIESFEFEENGRELTKKDTLHFKLSAYDADRVIKNIRVVIRRKNSSFTNSVTFHQSEGAENLYEGTYNCSHLKGYEGNYYVDKIQLEDETNNYVDWPVMEDGKYRYTFKFKDTGTFTLSDYKLEKNSSNTDGMLREGDTVTLTAQVKCEDIEMGSAQFRIKTVNSPSYSEYIYMEYNAETKTLTGTYTVQETTYPSEWTIDRIYIYSERQDFFFDPGQDESGKNLKFTVVNDKYDREKPVIKSITIDKNGQTVKAGEKVSVKVKVEEKNPSSSMNIKFTPQASGVSYLNCYLYLNSNTMEYTGTINITQNSYPTKWELTYLSLSDENRNITTLSDFKPDWNTTRPWYYTVDPEGYLDDTKPPVIESIAIDKNGQMLHPGDTVTLTVKVDEEHPSSRANAYFYPQVSNVSSNESMSLHYNADTKEYIGSISITNNTYPCEWMLTSLSVSDLKGNSTSLDKFKPDWRETCPWYYRVETDETYREDVKDATFSIQGYVRGETGAYSYGPIVENKTIKVGRRDSIKGLKLCPPLPAEGINVKYREENTGMEIGEDTELFFGNTSNPSYDFRAVYDKICVNAVLTYVSKDKGMTMAIVPQFVDKDATYGEMLTSFVPPEDADQDLLSGYELDGGDENARVEDMGYVGIKARYENCLVAWNIKYLDENGNEASKIVSKTYEKGTTIRDALADLEVPAVPEGIEFEKWALPGIDGSELIFHEMTNLDVTAVYKGKTTAEVSYTYRGEEGKLVSGSRLIALDGENLTYNAALTEVKKALNDLNHLKDLVLSDWVGIAAGTDIARYKKMNIQAKYANCVVILKYPKDVFEYVVVEKDSDFTLPVENETYMDILWEGFEQGQTVKITGDKEFIVADAKHKDGATEEPSGEKLSEEEIQKIVSDIEQNGSGETVHVEMGKATVVPKEILEAIKGKEVNIVLDMGAYSWSISGDEVAATDLKDIDLEVIVDTDGIPPAIVDSLAGGNPATQITLTHNGEFGFRADLTVNLGAEHSGSTGKLYYYDSSGKMIYMDAGEIGEDGNISLSFSHASEYVVVFEKAPLDQDDETDSGNKGEGTLAPDRDEKKDTVSNGGDEKKGSDTSGSDEKKENDFSKRKSPKTGE